MRSESYGIWLVDAPNAGRLSTIQVVVEEYAQTVIAKKIEFFLDISVNVCKIQYAKTVFSTTFDHQGDFPIDESGSAVSSR